MVITLGIDCQADRVEWQVVGWGRDFRRYVIDYGVIPGHISEDITRAARWSAQANLAERAGGALGIDRAAIDGNAWTEDVWGWAKRHPRSKLIMVRGRGEDSAPRIARVKKRAQRPHRQALEWAGPVLQFRRVGAEDGALPRPSRKRTRCRNPALCRFRAGSTTNISASSPPSIARRPRNAMASQSIAGTRTRRRPMKPLDTMNQAETAADHFGIRGCRMRSGQQLEQERENQYAPVAAQADIEDLLAAAPAAVTAPAAKASPSLIRRGGRSHVHGQNRMATVRDRGAARSAQEGARNPARCASAMPVSRSSTAASTS